MKYIKLTLFVLLSILPFSYILSQNKTIDSLKHQTLTLKDSSLIAVLNEISWYYKSADLDSALFYANKALSLSKKINHQHSIAHSYNSLGNVFEAKSNLDSASYYFKKNLDIKSKLNDLNGVAASYNNLGIINDQKGNYLKALQYYFSALKIYEKHQASFEKVPMVLVNIGIVYKKQKKFDKVLNYYKKALDIYKENNFKIGEVITTGNIGSILLKLERYRQSIDYSIKARKLYDSLGYKRYMAYMDVNMAIAKDSLKLHEQANKLYNKSIDSFKKDNNLYELSNAKVGLAQNLFYTENYSESIHQLNEALKVITEKNFKEFKAQAYQLLAKNYAKTNNFKRAFEYYIQYTEVKNQLYEQEKTKAIFELETQYETEKKEKEIVLQKEEILENELKIKNRNLYAALLGGALLIVGILSIGYYHRSSFKRKQLEKEIELKDALSKIKTQNRLQEQRLRISRDLHDNIGSQLTFIISSIDNLKYISKDLNDALKSKLTNISDFTSDTIHQLRDTIWAMNKNEISVDDFSTRLLSFIEKAKEAVPSITFKYKNTIPSHIKFTSIEGMNLFRVTQEAINNAVKYSEGDLIELNATQKDNKLQLTIQDNGKGFDINNVPLGSGLSNMEKRMSSINGSVFIASENGKGATITLQINNTTNDV